MSELNPTPHDPVSEAYQDGRRVGFATAALALSVVSFLNMVGFEKSILAAMLAMLAMRGAKKVSVSFRRGRTALIVAAAHIATIALVLVLFHDKILQALQKLS